MGGRTIPRGTSTWKTAKSHRESKAKTTVSVYISRHILEEARLQGLNLSRILEEALIQKLNQIKAEKAEKGGIGTAGSDRMVLRAGFEPASPARKAGILGRAILPEHFKVLSKGVSNKPLCCYSCF